MLIVNDQVFNNDPVRGTNQPEVFWGADAPSTDSFFTHRPVSSLYLRRVSANQAEEWIKVKDESRADDYACVNGVISERIAVADMTDGGGATGTYVLNGTIPAGAFVERALLTTLTDFVGSAAVTFTIGDGTDVDRYNTGTPSLATTAVALNPGVPSGTQIHVAAIATITFTVTDDTDFGDLVAGGGAVTLSIWYVAVPAA